MSIGRLKKKCMANETLFLMALEPLPRSDWRLVAGNLLKKVGMYIDDRGNSLRVWEQRKQSDGLDYSDGWRLDRMWLAPERSAIRVIAKRFYFIGSTNDLDQRSENDIFSGSKRPPVLKSAEKLASQLTLLKKIESGFDLETNIVTLSQVECDLGSARKVCIGDGIHSSPPDKLSDLYRKNGFDQVPNKFTILVCLVDSVSEDAFNRFKKGLERSAARYKAAVTVMEVKKNKVVCRLRDLRSSGERPVEGRTLLFVLPSKDSPPTPETMSLFDEMEAANVPFRRAYDTDPLEYSIPDQFPSLLLAAGGRPHRSPSGVKDKLIWQVGVDLSHQSNSSILALTLIDPNGILVGAWTIEQPLDETARVKSMSRLLVLCHERLSSIEQNPKVIVLRDGRFFENEDVDLYKNVLKANVSLFEYRKNGNPQIIVSGSESISPTGPFAATVKDESTMFVVTVPAYNANSLHKVAKVTWRSEWNGLDLVPSEIARVLTASAAAPGLGLKSRHLPAAIYWADGIAGANARDLRFKGVAMERAPAIEEENLGV